MTTVPINILATTFIMLKESYEIFGEGATKPKCMGCRQSESVLWPGNHLLADLLTHPIVPLLPERPRRGVGLGEREKTT